MCASLSTPGKKNKNTRYLISEASTQVVKYSKTPACVCERTSLAAGLYVVRHGALYYTLGKWVLEWNKQLFDEGNQKAGESEDGFQG